MGTRKNFFEICRKFGHVSSKSFVSPDLDHKDRDNKVFWNDGNYLQTDKTSYDRRC